MSDWGAAFNCFLCRGWADREGTGRDLQRFHLRNDFQPFDNNYFISPQPNGVSCQQYNAVSTETVFISTL